MWIAIQNAVGARQGVGGGPGPGPGYTPPLDDYTGALVAYSIRKVRSAYSGPAIEAERFSDGATQDIGFDSNGLIDTTALTTFASGSTVGVRTWYDQSGNDNHAVQTVQANQPRIYDGSNLYKTESGKLYVRGNGDYWWELTTDITTAQSIFDSRITSSSTSVSTNFLFGDTSYINYHSGETPSNPIYLATFVATYVRNGDNYENGVLRDFTSYLHPLSAQVLISMFHTSASGRINELSRDRLAVPGKRSWGGFWQETIIYGDDRSGIRTAFESNQNSYYQVTNLPDYTSGFLADYTGAAAAYSVRQLSNTAIKCMRVRRAVPPFDERDIGFTAGGDIDEAAIVAFGGSDALVVSAWYDQSGQSNHATQINPSYQPKIYDGTSVVTENGKPAIDFQVSRKELSAGAVLDVSSRDIYQWSVYSLQTGAFWTPIIEGPLYSATNQNTYQPRLVAQRTSSVPIGNSSSGLVLDQQYLRHDYADTSNARTFLDGDSSPVIDLVDNNSDWSTDVLSIGTVGTTPDTYMKVSEVLLWQTGAGTVPSNRTGIETNIMTYFNIP